MACISPLLVIVDGIDSSGKEILRLGNPYFKESDGSRFKNKDGCRRYTIPCGKCIECRRAQAREWSNRLMCELEDHDSAYFITLTYDDSHLHVVKYFDESTGEIDWNPTLDKRDIQLFFKSLRNHFPDDKIRYYIAGEYGPTTHRPHYHAIVFGLHLIDLVPFGRSETGNQYFVSQSVSDIWNRGFVSVEPADEGTCMYTASYVTSKLGKDPDVDFRSKGIVPPFALSSRRPGIGVKYLLDHKDQILENDRIYLSSSNGGLSFKPPRIFYKLISEDEYAIIRQRHIVAAEDAVLDLERSSDLDVFGQYQIRARASGSRLKVRDKV